MNEVKSEKKKLFEKKDLALGLSIVFVLCIGIVWGYIANQSATPDSCLSYDIPHEAKNASSENAEVIDDEIVYSTFSLPDAYFTFEYPSTWTYEKEESAPGEEYNETFWNFYADADKKQNTITLHYPMKETALDTCLKFDSVADYTYSQFATNDPGTFVSYLDCQATAVNTETKPSDLGSRIDWKKGVLINGNTEVSTEEGTKARIFWAEELTGSEVLNYIAHSIKVIE